MITNLDNRIDILKREDIDNLAAKHDWPCVSLYMPTVQAGKEVKQNQIRLKNLLRVAREQLLAADLKRTAITELLDSAQKLQENMQYWQRQVRGLALFIAPDTMLNYHLPLEFDEMVILGRRFHIKPLLPALSGSELFYVLTLNMDGVRFCEGSRYHLREVNLTEVPQNLADELQYDEFEKHVQAHTGTGKSGPGDQRSAMFYGQGTASNDAIKKDQLQRFLRQLDNGVCDYLGDGQAPLILAGLEYMQAAYREANQYPDLFDQGIDGNPEELSDKELHQKAWALVQPHFQQSYNQAVTDYRRLSGQENRVAKTLNEIVPAAYYQRIDTLFVSQGIQQWGVFSDERNTITLHEDARPDNEDLLDFAVLHTLQNGGVVYSVAPGDMPDNSDAAAILRY